MTFWSRMRTDRPRAGARLLVATDAAYRTWWRARSCRPARASTGRGWALLTLDPDKLVVEYRRGDLTRPDGGSQAFERFTQANGTNRVTRESLAV